MALFGRKPAPQYPDMGTGVPIAPIDVLGGVTPPPAAPQGVPSYQPPSTFNRILGALGDGLAAATGGQPMFGPMQAARRQQAMQAQMAQQQRANEFSDWQQKYDYEVAHPKANSGTSLQQNYQWLQGIDPKAAQSYLATQTTAPPVVVTNADGTRTVYPAGAVPQGSPPQQQVLQQLPAGVKPIGGASPGGSRTFPLR